MFVAGNILRDVDQSNQRRHVSKRHRQKFVKSSKRNAHGSYRITERTEIESFLGYVYVLEDINDVDESKRRRDPSMNVHSSRWDVR